MSGHLYTATAQATGGRQGRGATGDGVVSVRFSLPKAIGGTEEKGTTNPEQLFALGYASCFGSSVVAAARLAKIELQGEVVVNTKVHLDRKAAGGFVLAVELEISVPGVPRAKAQELVTQAHETICPYSQATRGNIAVVATAV